MNFNDKVRAMALRLIGNNNSIISAAAEAIAPKEYIAFLAQESNNEPTAVVHKNTLGAAIVYSYGDAGSYEGVLIGAFPTGRTIITHYTADPTFIVSVTDEDTISILADDDDIVSAASHWFKIEVHPE